uniref:Aquaporin 1a (Colton blood group), tandem duplicate 2 n=1 Tax=Nothobranchius furzeri TaxID=105023 RepID=A0A8C6LTC9_NOTFU
IFCLIGIWCSFAPPAEWPLCCDKTSYADHELNVTFIFSFASATLTRCMGNGGGAPLNLAITLNLPVVCVISAFRVFFFLIAQILNAVAGAIVYGVRPETTASLCVDNLNQPASRSEFQLNTDKRHSIGEFAPLVTGKHNSLALYGLISQTGCGINPARSFGPAVILKSFDDVYWVGPMSAGVAAALVCDYRLTPRDELLGEQTRVWFCCSSDQGTDAEPLLEAVRGREGSK